MWQVRGKLIKRFQDEAPLAHPRMGNLQFARANDEVSEQQNIDIDGAGAFRHHSPAAHPKFYRLGPSEQEPGKEFRLYFHYQIQKPGLVEQVLWLGFVNRRPAQGVNTCGFEPI